MPRPRSFSEDGLLESALDVFWKHGFEAASMQSLVDASGVHRGSLYATFGNKAELYRAALERYAERGLSRLGRLLAREATVAKAVEKLLLEVAADANTSTRGCFMVNAATERASLDAEVQRIVRQHFEAVAAMLEGALREAQRRGELSAQLDPAGVAGLILAAVQGIRVLAKAGVKPSRLRKAAKSLVPVLT